MVRQRGSAARDVLARAVVAALVLFAGVNPVAAQDGAERYEVTITPPKRPGTEAPVAEADEAAAASGAAADAPPADPADNELGGEPAGADAAQAPAAPAAKAAVPSSAAPTTATETARAATNLPLRTLQVGAYRLEKSAQSMRNKLAASFEDVTILEVQSGGEALYRVNVGRLPRGPALEDLRRRLVAAGHPAFDVPLPPVDAGD